MFVSNLVSRISKLIAPVLLLATTGIAQANTYYVGNLGTDSIYVGDSLADPFATIQYAINTAVSGDTIFVIADTYSGAGNTNLDFSGKDLTLEALPYDDTTTTATIDCQGSGSGFFFTNGESSASIVDGFTIINANESGYYGGGAFIDNSSPTFIDCTFASNTASYGGAVYIYDASPHFTGVTFSKNSATSDGGAVYQDYYSGPTYAHCNFTSNKAVNTGGAVYLTYGSGNFFRDTFTSNKAKYGGAYFGTYYAGPSFYGGTFSKNAATYYGGAIYNLDHSDSSWYNTLIKGNTAQYGGAVFNWNNTYPFFENVTITGNKATSSGGATYNGDYASPYFYYSILWNNKVGTSESEIHDKDFTDSSYVYDCDISGGWSRSGSGNHNTDPKFVSSTDFHLQAVSPLIDAGSTNGLTLDDHDGNPRVANFYLDLGAYERPLPTAYNDSYSMSANSTLTVGKASGILANDLANRGGTLSATLVTNPNRGTLTLKSDGSFTYRSAPGYHGTQTFTYKAKNTKGYSSPATVKITIS